MVFALKLSIMHTHKFGIWLALLITMYAYKSIRTQTIAKTIDEVNNDIMSILSKHKPPTGHAVDNEEFNKMIKRLQDVLKKNETNSIVEKVKFSTEFIFYDKARIQLENEIEAVIAMLNRSQRENPSALYLNLIDRLRTTLNKSNAEKFAELQAARNQQSYHQSTSITSVATTTSDTTSGGHIVGTPTTPSGITLSDDYRKMCDNLEKCILLVLRKYGIYGSYAQEIVDAILKDEKQLARLKEKLDDLEGEEDWSYWDIFEYFG